MGTEILRPQDCFVERFPVLGYYNNTNNLNNNINKKTCMVQTYQKKRTNNYQNHHQHQQQQNESSKVVVSSRHSNNTRNECEMRSQKVPSFRRGGSLDSLNVRINKDRRTFVNQADNVLYAGSACSVSPSPSSLPLPTFFQKQEFNSSFDDSATRDLRRLLRLE